MPLKLEKRKGSGIWRIRGTVQGVRVDRSAKTRSRVEAKQIAKLIQEEINRAAFSDTRPKGYTFSDAAVSYMKSGRGQPYDLEPVILLLGDTQLSEITQGMIDRKALERWPDAKVSTRLRYFYAPVGAILTYAQGERMMSAFRIKRPSLPTSATEWRTPAEAEKIIKAMRGMAPLTTFLFGTGCRISEACRLQWKDVSPDGQSVTLWVTKSVTRTLRLCNRTRSALPERRERDDYVWLNDNGNPWAAGANGAFSGPRVKMARRCDQAGLPHTSPHICRHSWASWSYALSPDTITLMVNGGWGSLDLVQRYTHLGTDDLAAEVKKHRWQEFGQYLGRKTRRAVK